MLADFSLQGFLFAVRNNGSADLAAALQNAHHGSLVFANCTSDATPSFLGVHVAGLAANEGFVSFHFAGQHVAKPALGQGKTDPMMHDPSGLLSYTEIAGGLAGANTVF